MALVHLTLKDLEELCTAISEREEKNQVLLRKLEKNKQKELRKQEKGAD